MLFIQQAVESSKQRWCLAVAEMRAGSRVQGERRMARVWSSRNCRAWGCLGGSIGLALRKRNLADHVVGVGEAWRVAAGGRRCGAVQSVETRPTEGVRGADLAIMCTPVKLVEEYVMKCLQDMPPGGLITDVGSTKGGICEGLLQAAATSFCGSHPLAGSDKSGVAFAEDRFASRTIDHRHPLGQFAERSCATYRTSCGKPWVAARSDGAGRARSSGRPNQSFAACGRVGSGMPLPTRCSPWRPRAGAIQLV